MATLLETFVLFSQIFTDIQIILPFINQNISAWADVFLLNLHVPIQTKVPPF